MKKLEVVAAIIIKDNKILCTQRAGKGETALKWEFPGGKIEENETNKKALAREIREELSIDVDVCDYFMSVEHEYKSFGITMHGYICNIKDKDIKLNEHVDYCWLDVDELDNLDWSEADKPIVEELKNMKTTKNRNRKIYALMMILVMCLGLFSRKMYHYLPDLINSYLGDGLWAMMIYFAAAVGFNKSSVKRIIIISLVFCYGIELSQLYHEPWIDSIRNTTLGGLVLGYGFLWKDIVAYTLGVLFGSIIDKNTKKGKENII